MVGWLGGRCEGGGVVCGEVSVVSIGWCAGLGLGERSELGVRDVWSASRFDGVMRGAGGCSVGGTGWFCEEWPVLVGWGLAAVVGTGVMWGVL